VSSFKDIINSVVYFPELFTVGTVAAVDESTYSCDVQPEDGGPLLKDVPLRVRRDNDKVGVTIVPAPGTTVIVMWISDQRPTVFQVQKWTKVIIQDESGLGFVITASDRIKAGIEGRATHPVGHGDTIYDILDDLIDKYNNHTHGDGDIMPGDEVDYPPQDFRSDEVFTS
jgi:hypothetical protein